MVWKSCYNKLMRLVIKKEVEVKTFSHRIAYNLISQIGEFDENG